MLKRGVFVDDLLLFGRKYEAVLGFKGVCVAIWNATRRTAVIQWILVNFLASA